MRISDWSSDVCSSDLLGHGFLLPGQAAQIGLAYAEVGAGQMRARQGFPRQRAMGRPRRGFVATRKSADDGAGLAVQGSKPGAVSQGLRLRSEEHTSELQSLMRISYDVFCLKNN